MDNLLDKRCRRRAGGEEPLSRKQVEDLLAQVPGWTSNSTHSVIERTFEFKNYYETMAFVNALAWLAHREDHHPDIEVSYRRCQVRFTTHSIDGLSENDFICAAKLGPLIG